MDMEWKPIVGFEGRYEVSNTGLIRSVDRIIIKMRTDTGERYMYNHKGKIIKTRVVCGYLMFVANSDKPMGLLVHRCVAQAFIKNPNGYKVVNHIDGNKLNNNVDNLEWTTYSGNNKHAFDTGLRKPTRMLAVQCVETGKVFESIQSAARFFNGDGSNLTTAIKRGWGFKGYHFEYINKT